MNKLLKRDIKIITEKSKDDNIVSLFASSEELYKRHDDELGEYWELISHKNDDIDISRLRNKGPFLFEHIHSNVLGVIEHAEVVNEKRLFLKVRMSKNPFPQEVLRDIRDGIRTKISLGYLVTSAEIIGTFEGLPVVSVKVYCLEASSVGVPADDTVSVVSRRVDIEDINIDNIEKIGYNKLEKFKNVFNKRGISFNDTSKNTLKRKIKMKGRKKEIYVDEEDVQLILNKLEELEDDEYIVLKKKVSDEEVLESEDDNENKYLDDDEDENDVKLKSEDDEKEKVKVDFVIQTDDNNERKKRKFSSNRITNDIYARAEELKISHDKVNEFIRGGGNSLDNFERFASKILKERNNMSNRFELNLKNTDKEIREYDILRAIDSKKRNVDCLELELSKEIAKERGIRTDSADILIPTQAFKNALIWGLNKRALSRDYNAAVGNASGLFNTIEEHLEGVNDFMDILRPLMLIPRLAVNFINNANGNYSFPRMVEGNTSTWSDFGVQSTSSSPKYVTQKTNPRMLTSESIVQENMRYLSVLDSTSSVLFDIMQSRAQELDAAFFNGDGVDSPMGVLNLSGIASIALGENGSAVTRDAIIDLDELLDFNNVNAELVRRLTNTAVKNQMRKTKIDDGSGLFLWNEFDDTLVSNIIPNDLKKGTGEDLSAMILGDFSKSTILNFDTLSIVTDPYTGANQGITKVYARQAHDFIFNNPDCFAVIKDIKTK